MSTYNVRFIGSEEVAYGTQAFHFEKPGDFKFKPGQAIDLILPMHSGDDGQPARHAFSLVSAPAENRLTIATRMRGSPFKQAMSSLSAGTTVGLDGPFGALTLHHDQTRPATFIVGGIGITPFMSIMRQAATDPSARSLTLLYSNRRPEDAAFLAELQAMAGQMPNFQLVATMTQIGHSKQAWSGMMGHIDAGMLTRIAAGLSSPIYYLAGPPKFVEATQNLLNETGVDDDDIRSEGFHGY